MEIGVAFLSSAMNVLFDRMASPMFINLFRGQKPDDDQLLNKLKTTMLSIHAVLDDAESKQNLNRHVKEWLNELYDAVYHAEDLVDEIHIQALRIQVETGHRRTANEVSDLSLSLDDEFVNGIILRIKEMIATFECYVSQINVLGLKRVIQKKDNSYRLPSTSLVDELDVYGRDNDREKIIQMVLSDDANSSNITVIPILGLGGIGKTTLAQVVYNDHRVNDKFDVKAWVCVSQEYDAFMVTKTLLVEVNSSNAHFNFKDDFNLLQVNLKHSLAKKKFLIVLDDVWNENYNDWDKIKVPLKHGRQGSKIIVTTRHEKVARMMQTEAICSLDPISDEDCWSLFKVHAFANGVSVANPKLEVIGRETVKKCKGLPLAVKTLGGLLRSTSRVDDWIDILRSNTWNLSSGPHDILPVLRLSYNHLPSHLKRCFAYCVLFPKGYSFRKQELIFLWIANDLLNDPARNDKTIQEIGDEYFNELRSRSFFQETGGSSFLMHDLVNDLAQSIGGEFCVRLEDYPAREIPRKVRHFSYLSKSRDAFEKFKPLVQVKNLRTFLPIYQVRNLPMLTKKVLPDIILRLGRLRVLSLSSYNILALPDSIGNLKHLRLLDLSSTLIKRLPDSICTLYALQILLLSHCNCLDELPSCVGNLKCLMYLDLSQTKIQKLPESVSTLYNLETLLLSECLSLRELPIDMGKLINLRCLDLRGTRLREMPSHVSKLRNLHYLNLFIVGKNDGLRIGELGELDFHGCLSITGLQNVNNGKDALKVRIKNHENLEDLVLQWDGSIDDSQTGKDILEKLEPHTNLLRLTINEYSGTRFPDWLGEYKYTNIVYLCLRNCKNCFSLPALGQLPSLRYLTLIGMDKISMISTEFYGDGSLTKPFQSLVNLRIAKMPELKEWVTPDNVELSGLRELRIINCPKLIGELHFKLSGLTKLEISGCPHLVHDGQMSILRSVQVNLQGGHLSSLQFLKIANMPILELPEELLGMGLKKLTIEKCPSIVSFPKGSMMHIDVLVLEDCSSFESVPTASPSMRIKELCINNCKKLEFQTTFERSDSCYNTLESLKVGNSGDSLNEISLGAFPKLRSLSIHKSEGLKLLSIPRGFQNLASLHSLKISSCGNLLSFPERGFPAPNLESLSVYWCKKLKSLPKDMCSHLPSLRVLCVHGCPGIESFPKDGLPSSLEIVEIRKCEKLMTCRGDWGLQRLPFLRKVTIGDTNEESFPKELLLPCSLRVLHIWAHLNMKAVNYKDLQQLTSLESLTIWDCPKLQSLPEEGLPTSLSKLDIRNCPLLTPRLERENGEDWPKLANIPCVIVDNELIS